MRWSLATSLGLHAAILVAALVVLPNQKLDDVKPSEAIMVDISTIGDASKKMAMATDAEKPAEKPKSKKAEVLKKADPKATVAKEEKKTAKVAQAAPPPEEAPVPKEVPPKKEEPPKKAEPKVAAEPKPLDPDPLKNLIKDTMVADEEAAKLAEQKAEEKKSEEKKKADEKKVANAKKKAEAKKKLETKKKTEKFDVAKLEDLLNSDTPELNKENDQKTTNASESTDDGTPTKGEANIQGTDNQMVGTIVDALVSKVRECWSVPPGAREANMSVRIHFQLNQDGTIEGTPQVENSSSDPIFDATARSAVAALMQCQAYQLPQDRYDLWKDNTLDFNPNLMFQG